MADATVRKEFRPLLQPKVAQGASSAQVVWARVKGYPSWPAQVLSEAAARKKLGKVSHKDVDVPVMFFGTLEIAWIGRADVVTFSEGIQKGFLGRGKHKTFLKAVAQVMDFLACNGKKSKAPQQWWCKPLSPDDFGPKVGSSKQQDISSPSQSADDDASASESEHSSSDAEPAADANASGGSGVRDTVSASSSSEDDSESEQHASGNGVAPNHHRDDVISLEEQAILKLPIEIRRLAGIKVVKKPPGESAPRARRMPDVAASTLGEHTAGVLKVAASPVPIKEQQPASKPATSVEDLGDVGQPASTAAVAVAQEAALPLKGEYGVNERDEYTAKERDSGSDATTGGDAPADSDSPAGGEATMGADADASPVGELSAVEVMAGSGTPVDGDVAMAEDASADDAVPLAEDAAPAGSPTAGGIADDVTDTVVEKIAAALVAATDDVEATARIAEDAAPAESDSAAAVREAANGAQQPAASVPEASESVIGDHVAQDVKAAAGATASSEAAASVEDACAAAAGAPAPPPDTALEQATAMNGLGKHDVGGALPPSLKPRPLSKEAARADMLERKRLRERERREEAKRKRLRKSSGNGSDPSADPPLPCGESDDAGTPHTGGDLVMFDAAAELGPAGWLSRVRERRAMCSGRQGSGTDVAAPDRRPVKAVRSVGPDSPSRVPAVFFDAALAPLPPPPPQQRIAAAVLPASVPAVPTASVERAAASRSARSGGGAAGSVSTRAPEQQQQQARSSSSEDALDAEAAAALQMMGMCIAQPSSSKPDVLPPAPPPSRRPKRPPPVEGFMWPECGPLLPDCQESFVPPGEWLNVRPPQYEHIKRSVWLSKRRPGRQHKDNVSVCYCVPPDTEHDAQGLQASVPGHAGCKAGCLNRQSFVHCDPRACPCGEQCGNKPFHLLKMPRIQTFLTENRGHGVRAMQFIARGTFVVEYVGEVLDSKELDTRMAHARAIGEEHFYIMELDNGLFVDARYRGNQARLLNSSCDPNCETQKWHDAATGEARIAIFARRDIAPGEELTYDYFFEHYGTVAQLGSSFRCMCGAKNCRGTMDVNPEKRRDLGRRVEVLWEDDGIFYQGTIIGFNPANRKHVVLYDDGNQEKVCLEEVQHRWLTHEVAPAVAAAAAAAHPLRIPGNGIAVGHAVPVEPPPPPRNGGHSVSPNAAALRPPPALLNAILGVQLKPCSVPLFQHSSTPPVSNQIAWALPSHMQVPCMVPGMAVAQCSGRMPRSMPGSMAQVFSSSVLAGMPASEMSTVSLFKAIMNRG
mmetsp:Transcript_21384/g.64125  ORF Transcript_21384/g.64125 Transcript_21384/m.64125 type:complete len:1271 (-) Transcript_21384:161-3973(-)